MPCNVLIKIYILILCVAGTLGYAFTRKTINKRLLKDIKLNMNEKISPCKDFYQYACGHWDYQLPFYKNYTDTIGSLEYKTNLKIKHKLKETTFQSHMLNNDIYHKVATYYNTCELQENFNVKEYLKIIKPTDKDEWPKDGEYWSPKHHWSIWSSLAKLQTIGFNGFLLTLNVKRHNSTHFYMHLDKMDNLDFTKYEKRIFDDIDYTYDMETYLVYAKVENFLKRLFLLNKQHKQTSNIYREITAVDLQKLITNIDFKTFFSTLWGEEYKNLKHLTLKVYNFNYFRDLAVLLNDTDMLVLVHTLKLRFLDYMEKQIPSTAHSLKCLQHMRDLVPLALDYIYEQEIYQPIKNKSDRLINKLFKNMKQKFFSIIAEHSQEFSLEEINFLKRKLDLMKLNIGNMPLVTDKNFYHKYFESWQVNEGLFYWNHINALQHFYRENFKLLITQPWFNPLHTYFHWPYATPAYQPTNNLLIIPFAYLQYPIFHTKFHELFLYAELGNTLGHEMLHAFDTNGLQYDALGNPSAVFIKSLPDKKSLMASLECISKFGAFSLNEIIADISGFRLAYDLYFTHQRESSDSETGLSNKQLFFIKFAQFFCSAHPYYDEAHDSPSYRVRKVVASHPEFEKVFKCQQDSYTRELEKCSLW